MSQGGGTQTLKITGKVDTKNLSLDEKIDVLIAAVMMTNKLLTFLAIQYDPNFELSDLDVIDSDDSEVVT